MQAGGCCQRAEKCQLGEKAPPRRKDSSTNLARETAVSVWDSPKSENLDSQEEGGVINVRLRLGAERCEKGCDSLKSLKPVGTGLRMEG